MDPSLSQAKCITDLLDKAQKSGAKGISTPIVGGCKLTKYSGDYMVDHSIYRSIVGALQNATIK